MGPWVWPIELYSQLCATFGMHCSGSFIFNVGEHKESPQLPIWNIAETVTVTSQLTSNAYKDHNKKNSCRGSHGNNAKLINLALLSWDPESDP
jgi:hypothetical protein